MEKPSFLNALPFLNSRKPDSDLWHELANKTEKHLHDIWHSSRDWHLSDENDRPAEHGHLLRSMLLATATLAGIYDSQESQGDADIKAMIAQANAGCDDPGHAGTLMMHARAISHICQHCADARKYIASQEPILRTISRQAGSFYQSAHSFFTDLQRAESFKAGRIDRCAGRYTT
jgi:hypothetical protein